VPIQAQFPEKLEALFKPKRNKILWGGRGAGRSWGIARALLLMGTEKPIRVLCARELQNSIAESVHKLLSDQIEALGLGHFYHIQVQGISGVNGTSFSFAGIKNNANKIKSYEGIDYCWVEEGNKVTRASWSVLLPTIRKPGSEIWVSFNPELITDYTYTRFVLDPELREVAPGVKESENSITIKMTYADNPWFAGTALVAEMEGDRVRDYDHYLNIWEGHPVAQLEGAIYAKELRKAQEEGRICTVPWDQETPVSTFWDLGRADYTAIWFAQRVAMQFRVLGFYKASGLNMADTTGGVQHFLRECQKRGYVYDTFYLPFDAKAKRLGSGRTVQEIIQRAGYKVQIVPRHSRTDGINAARIIFPNCYFDERLCADGLTDLRHYRYKVIDGHVSNEPLHDEASDGADAFRYMALSLKAPKGKTTVGQKLKGLLGSSDRASAQSWMGS
jgi:phage terminase large subunit